MRGHHGIVRENEAGKELLSFCALNELATMNTFFEKRSIYKYTWQHPGNKKWHCIDYILMKKRQKWLCSDDGVLRSTDCWTDDKLLRAKLQLRVPLKKKGGELRKRYAVTRLKDATVREKYSDAVFDTVSAQWESGLDGMKKWSILRDSLTSAAEKVLGWEKRWQPDWFSDNICVLEQLIQRRNMLFARWLKSHSQRDRQRYVTQRRAVSQQIRHSKNNWLQQKACEIERTMKGGVGAWKGLRDLQRGRVVLHPVKTRAIRDSKGNLCVGNTASLCRWQEHFQATLNIRSEYVEAAVQLSKQCPIRKELGVPPTEEEVVSALYRMKGSKAGGKTGILPEMVKSCGGLLLEYLMDLFQTVWKEGRVPEEWRDAILIPIPKKGDLSYCANWQVISLLDTVGKLFTKVIQARLQSVVEDVLVDSQCGFRSGRGCVDMIFCAWQLMEKAREHRSDLFILFVDLRKAYDSVPRQALWLVVTVLHKYGIPTQFIQLIQSLHEGMKAEVAVGGTTSPVVEVNNGLHQGCTIAASLFNLYFNLVMRAWRSRCQSIGVDVLYKFGGKLVGEWTRRPLQTTVTQLLFADDAVVVASGREDMERAAHVLDDVTTEWGLTMSLVKTKLLIVSEDGSEEDQQPIIIRGQPIEVVDAFKYLGAVVEGKGEVVLDVEDKIARASRAFSALCRPVFNDGNLSRRTKRMVYRVAVLGVLLYGAETWVNKRDATQKLQSFYNKCLRCITHITREQQRTRHITSVQVRRWASMDEALEDLISAERLRWLGHVSRMEDRRLPKKLLFGWLQKRRPAHGTKMRWRDKVKKDMKKFNIKDDKWCLTAQDRRVWRAECKVGVKKCTQERLESDRRQMPQ